MGGESGVRVKALLFDFDGIVIDTEASAFGAWQEVFEAHGHVLALEEWARCVGTIGGFEPLDHLEALLGHPVPDREGLNERRLKRDLELTAAETLRPGVEGYLARAEALGLRVAIVSSSSTPWITSHLERVGRSDGWACITCANGDATRAKPLPCLYEEALEALGIAAGEAIAFEDSTNGVRAAKAAGIFCVAVPNDVTRSFDLTDADLRVESFEDASLDEIIAAAESRSS